VSLYNETDGNAIYPTPVLGVVGLIEDASHVIGRSFRGSGEAIVLLGETRHDLGGSEYLKVTQRVVAGTPPEVDLQAEKALQRLIVAGVRDELIRSAHDCSEGGLAIALAECAFGTGGVGLTVNIPAVAAPDSWASTSTLFSESASRVIISVARDELGSLLARAKTFGVPAREIGQTGSDRISVSINGRRVIDMPVGEAEGIWDSALETHFRQRAA
jgi:phosphoribosylformylglycinamidine synthase